jgi:hypothetical protein
VYKFGKIEKLPFGGFFVILTTSSERYTSDYLTCIDTII